VKISIGYPTSAFTDAKTMSSKKSKPYSEKSDIEKIESNWKKVSGLFDREEWSSAVVRAATASEIATNLALREELEVKRNVKSEFVDSLLKWATKIQGKFDRLLLPVTKGTALHNKFKKVRSKVTEINDERNAVAHSGQFKKRTTAEKVCLNAKEVIEVIVGTYHKNYRLMGLEEHLTSASSRRGKSRS
jgi:hypothetical protein